jgi:hypothetical protein
MPLQRLTHSIDETLRRVRSNTGLRLPSGSLRAFRRNISGDRGDFH